MWTEFSSPHRATAGLGLCSGIKVSFLPRLMDHTPSLLRTTARHKVSSPDLRGLFISSSNSEERQAFLLFAFELWWQAVQWWSGGGLPWWCVALFAVLCMAHSFVNSPGKERMVRNFRYHELIFFSIAYIFFRAKHIFFFFFFKAGGSQIWWKPLNVIHWPL